MNLSMAPSPLSSPHTASGSSTPLTGGCGAIPFHHAKQPITCLQESTGMIPRSQSSFYPNSSSPYQEPKPDLFRVIATIKLKKSDSTCALVQNNLHL
ncbi:hypothetical protein D5086_000915 [Populus alba]|uniref:Uncharacterized protein n=1 Tax=Populus alba TaxID=43335 RepID=A0ACC4CYB7_POPAL